MVKNIYAYPPGAPPCRSRAKVFPTQTLCCSPERHGSSRRGPTVWECIRSIAGRTHKLFALMQHNKAAAFVFGGSHRVAPGHSGSILTDCFHCRRRRPHRHVFCCTLLLPSFEVFFVDCLVVVLELCTTNFQGFFDKVDHQAWPTGVSTCCFLLLSHCNTAG